MVGLFVRGFRGDHLPGEFNTSESLKKRTVVYYYLSWFHAVVVVGSTLYIIIFLPS